MRPTGFSTGALTKGNFKTALQWLEREQCEAIELSALREHELKPLLHEIRTMNLTGFSYKSIHVPKEFVYHTEAEVVEMLLPFAGMDFHFVLHPDAITDFNAWKKLGKSLCIENMDMRKHIGRTAQELHDIFEQLPDSRLCFDIGHARQVDPSMAVAADIIAIFGSRISHVHASEVDTEGGHWAMSTPCMHAFAEFSEHLSNNVAIIIESRIPRSDISREMDRARHVFRNPFNELCNL